MSFIELSSNQLLALFYIVANVVSIIITTMLIFKGRNNKQTSSIYFTKVLLFLIIYFDAEILWALSFFDIIGNAKTFLKVSRMIYYSAAAAVAYNWLFYIRVLMNPKLVYKRKRVMLMVPVLFSIVTSITIVHFFDPAQKSWQGYLTVLALILVPFSFVFDGGIRVLVKILTTKNETEKSKYVMLIIWPAIVLICSVAQVFIPEIPIFCFGSVIITIALFIFNQDSLVFSDGLTGIYNRKMLNSYLDGLNRKETHYILMVDVNSFKQINDNYGHLEGDNALKFIASELLTLIQQEGYFLARYGGDEFIIIAKTDNEEEIKHFIRRVKSELSKSKDLFPYVITASIGYCKMEENDTLAMAISKADEMLYEEKKFYHS